MSAKQQFTIYEKATGKEITCDWQNASELVFHGFWAFKESPRKVFERAQREARNLNPDPRGFDHLHTDETRPNHSDNDDDNDYAPAPVAAPVIQQQPFVPVPTINDIADTPIEFDNDGLEDMTKEELLAEAEKMNLKVDKRTGQKGLVNAIRNAKE